MGPIGGRLAPLLAHRQGSRQSVETAGRRDGDSGSLQIVSEGRRWIAEISASARWVPWFWNRVRVTDWGCYVAVVLALARSLM